MFCQGRHLMFLCLHEFSTTHQQWFSTKMIAGHFPDSVMTALVFRLCVPPCSCSVVRERTNRQKATAFPLIVISLSQEELSRDRAHTEQFSSPPIQTAAVFAEAEQLNGRKTTKHQTDVQNDERRNKPVHSFLCRTLVKLLTLYQKQ